MVAAEGATTILEQKPAGGDRRSVRVTVLAGIFGVIGPKERGRGEMGEFGGRNVEAPSPARTNRGGTRSDERGNRGEETRTKERWFSIRIRTLKNRRLGGSGHPMAHQTIHQAKKSGVCAPDWWFGGGSRYRKLHRENTARERPQRRPQKLKPPRRG